MKDFIQPTLVLDAESTLLQGECLDLLGLVVGGPALAKELESLTIRAMADGWDFRESLNVRIGRLIEHGLHAHHLEEVSRKLKPTASALGQRDWFRANSDKYYVISGGFEQCLDRSLQSLGIPLNRRRANRFIVDGRTGLVTGFDTANPLSEAGGKAKVIDLLGLNTSQLIAVGDGSNDLSIKLAGRASEFVAYTEVARRKPIVENPATNIECNEFSQVIAYFNNFSAEPVLW